MDDFIRRKEGQPEITEDQALEIKSKELIEVSINHLRKCSPQTQVEFVKQIKENLLCEANREFEKTMKEAEAKKSLFLYLKQEMQ